MELDPKVEQYRTDDPESFAFTTAQRRWPIAITGVIDDLHRFICTLEDREREKAGKQICKQLTQLKYDVEHNRELTPLEDDGLEDIERYNAELQQRSPARWHSLPWLFAECYLYRKIYNIFALSPRWKSYDYFARQKRTSIKDSRAAILELASQYRTLSESLESDFGGGVNSPPDPAAAKEAEKEVFREMIEICLWGNATDLSLLHSTFPSQLEKLQGSKVRAEARSRIVVNQTDAAYDILEGHRREAQRRFHKVRERRVDIVLDNAGFELFSDLILAGYLLRADLATVVVLHPKSIPWMVSDATPIDFHQLVLALADAQDFFVRQTEEEQLVVGPNGEKREHVPILNREELSNLQYLFTQWSDYHQDGKLIIRPNEFWTECGSFWRMPTHAPELMADLQTSDMVIFKGDMNYRKLTGDAKWDHSMMFDRAIGPLGMRSGLCVLALRTCKSDVITGIRNDQKKALEDSVRKEGEDGAEAPPRNSWAWDGRFAVVQLSNDKLW